MPNIRDLGISSIPAAARSRQSTDHETRWYLEGPTSQPLCECNPTDGPGCNPTNQPGCNPTNHPGCNPTNHPGCNPTNDQPGCNPTNQPGCNPTNDQPGCNPTNQPGCNPTNRNHSSHSPSIPLEAIAQLKSQLRHHISI